jgi:4-hydroxyphenylpyruvate dioxygenase
MAAAAHVAVDNFMGLDGFEFVEFTGPEPDALGRLFEALGFTHVSTHRSKNVRRYAQGDINFLLNAEPEGQVATFRATRGPSANAMAFRVKDARFAFEEALRRGAEPVEGRIGPMELNIPAIRGIGGANLYLVDRPGAASIYDVDFVPVAGATPADRSVGLHTLDHLTHNVGRGAMASWADYYSRIFGFRIPLNESQDENSQIEEFLRAYNGEGIQHIALATDDIFATVDRLRANGVKFQDSPDTYFDMIDQRLPGHGHSVEEMRRRRILIDGAPETGGGLLLQIFTENMIGPIFFEIIQRKGNEGFGEGNFQALFESLELDQIRRGVIPAGMRS